MLALAECQLIGGECCDDIEDLRADRAAAWLRGVGGCRLRRRLAWFSCAPAPDDERRLSVQFVSAERDSRLVADKDPLSHITYFERDDVLVVCVTSAGADHVGREHIIEHPHTIIVDGPSPQGSTSKALTRAHPDHAARQARVLDCADGDCQATRRAQSAARRPARAGRTGRQRPSDRRCVPRAVARAARPGDPGAVAAAGPRSCPGCDRFGARVEDHRRRTAGARAPSRPYPSAARHRPRTPGTPSQAGWVARSAIELLFQPGGS
jgi:hypothetical protein